VRFGHGLLLWRGVRPTAAVRSPVHRHLSRGRMPALPANPVPRHDLPMRRAPVDNDPLVVYRSSSTVRQWVSLRS